MNYFDHIEDYLQNRLSPEDRQGFETAMLTDVELQNAVKEADLVSMVGEAAFEEEVRGMIDTELSSKEYTPPAKKKMSYNTKLMIYLVVMAVLLVLMIGGYMRAVNQQIDTEKVQYADLYVEPAWPEVRGNNTDEISNLVTNYLSDKDSKYIDSLKMMKENPDALYWLSELYLYESKPDSTLKYLPSFNSNKVLRDRLNYLLILSFYQKQENEKVADLLKNLPPDTDSWYLDRYRLIIE